MKEYTTEQRKLLLAFLKEHCDQPFSIEEIALHLGDKSGISISAIYRNIGKLAADGEVQRFTKENSRKFYYQYIGDHICSEHLHLMCNKCGQVFHMDNQLTESLLHFAFQNNAFEIDKKKTILYGFCNSCSERTSS